MNAVGVLLPSHARVERRRATLASAPRRSTVVGLLCTHLIVYVDDDDDCSSVLPQHGVETESADFLA